MVILHTQFTDGKLFLWAESKENFNYTYPFAASGEILLEIVRPLFNNWREPPTLEISEPLLRMPVDSAGQPLPSRAFFSSKLMSLPPIAGEKHFRVPSLKCENVVLLTIFQAVLNRRISSFISNDLYKTAQLLHGAAFVISRGHVLPAINKDKTACWTAILQKEEDEWLKSVSLPRCVAMTSEKESLFNVVVSAFMSRAASTTFMRSRAKRGHFFTVHDEWLAGLTATYGAISDSDGKFSQELSIWSAPIMKNPFNFPLQISAIAPEEKTGLWRFDFSINNEKEPLETIEGLTLLGQATSIAPSITRNLTTNEMLFFIRHELPILENAGFAVVLPDGFRKADAKRVAMILENPSSFKPDETVLVKWTIDFFGSRISVSTLQAIVDAGESLIEFNGHWIEVDLQQLRSIISQFNHESETEMPLKNLLKSHITADRDIIATQEIQAFLRSFNGEKLMPYQIPENFDKILRPYQKIGFTWLMHTKAWGIGACLADDMGLGKTIQTIAVLTESKAPNLIIAPLSVLPVWENEIRRFAPNLRIYVHHGQFRFVNKAFEDAVSTNDVVLTSYALALKDYKMLRGIKWQILILDEAQMIKNPMARQSQAVRALTAEHRIALTGTPIENKPEDLWSIIDFLNPGILGTRSSFIRENLTPKKLQKKVQPYLLRRLKTDSRVISDLPEKIYEDVFCPLSNEQITAYDFAMSDFKRELPLLDGISRHGHILAMLTRLKQICDHPELPYVKDISEIPDEILTGNSGKINCLEKILKTILDNGESTLIFTQYARMGALLKAKLQERFAIDVQFLHGGLSGKKRENVIKAFSESQMPSIFILSLKAGGLGLNLTKANHIVHFDRWWNPAVENQATDRAYRIGQKRTVVVHKFICHGTLEDRIDLILQNKQLLADTVITPTPEKILAKLSNAEIIETIERTQ